LPYKFLEIYGAEADDIIGVLCSEYSEEIMIISGDKDFIQLQKSPNVKQYSPITKKMVNGENPGGYLKEHIFKGDTSDGVPNVLSPDNTFTDGLRQKPLTKKKIASWVEHNFEDVAPNDEVKRNYQRNRKLIDLTYTPEELSSEIINTYKEAPYGDRSKLLNYFIQKRLRNLTESIGEF
jgi:5'-3' exonuclease